MPDGSALNLADSCVQPEPMSATHMQFRFKEGAPFVFFDALGGLLTDLNLNASGDYPCDKSQSRLRAYLSPSDVDNPAYWHSNWGSSNCGTGSCTLRVVEPATSGLLKVTFTGHLGRTRSDNLNTCDYLDISFDVEQKISTPLN
jgi:hypothetical protein